MKAAFILAIVLAYVSTQRPVTVVNCCASGNNIVPTKGACPSKGRNLQAIVAPYCAAMLVDIADVLVSSRVSRRAQAVVPAPVGQFNVHNCVDYYQRRNSRQLLRRAQAVVVKKCPVSVNGWRCFKNNTNAKCVDNTE